MQIVEWYDELLRFADTPIVRLNRAVAVGEADGARPRGWPPGRGRRGRPRREAVAAHLHEQNGDLELAARLYADAARNAPNLAERDHQTRQAARLNQLPAARPVERLAEQVFVRVADDLGADARRRRSQLGSTPRTTATGMPVALPMTSSAAPAISSTTATSVTCISRPVRVGRAPAGRGSAPMPAQPMATSVSPRRHVRPNVSLMMTATSTPAACLDAVADAAGRAVAVVGQQGGVAPLDVRQVDAGVGAHEAVLGLADDEVAATAQHAHRLALDDAPCG